MKNERRKRKQKNLERERTYMNQSVYCILQILAGLLAAVSLAYFALITVRVGVQIFHFFFLLVSIGLGVCMLLGHSLHKGTLQLPRFIPAAFGICVVLACLVFGWMLGLILHGQSQGAEPGADYVLVLGAGLRGEKPSLILQKRLETAAEYLLDNPQAKVVVSGGQGFNESIPEALAMQRGLLALGIEEERILMEDESTSTVENMKFSLKYIAPEAKVVIVTNKFHIYRASHVAEECGYQHVSGKGSDNVGWLNPVNYIRECMAVFKDVIL